MKALWKIALFLCLMMLIATNALAQAQISVLATGLKFPRGLKFGPDGNLYVAEAGDGGTINTTGICPQVPFPVGPETGGFNARISKIDANGNRTTVVDDLPSSMANPIIGGDVLGVADVAFIGDTLYSAGYLAPPF